MIQFRLMLYQHGYLAPATIWAKDEAEAKKAISKRFPQANIEKIERMT